MFTREQIFRSFTLSVCTDDAEISLPSRKFTNKTHESSSPGERKNSTFFQGLLERAQSYIPPGFFGRDPAKLCLNARYSSLSFSWTSSAAEGSTEEESRAERKVKVIFLLSRKTQAGRTFFTP